MTAFDKGCTLLWDTLIPAVKAFDEDFVISGVDKNVFINDISKKLDLRRLKSRAFSAHS